MDTNSLSAEATPQEEAVPGKKGRQPLIVIRAATNPMQLQKVIKRVVKAKFEFRNTRNGTRVISKTLAEISAAKFYLETFLILPSTYVEPIKAVISHLTLNTPADNSDGMLDLGFDFISVKQMTSIPRSSSEEAPNKKLLLFFITLPRKKNIKRSSDLEPSATFQ
jgi:hypothetical protein